MLPFSERAQTLANLVQEHPVFRAPNENGVKKPCRLASAYSKLTWFLRPEDWTIFDRFLGFAACGTDKVSLPQLRSFYAKLAPTWPLVSGSLSEAACKHGFNPLLGARIADKWLFLHGVRQAARNSRVDGVVSAQDNSIDGGIDLSSSAIANIRTSLLATKQVLQPYVGTRLDALAEQSNPISTLPNG